MKTDKESCVVVVVVVVDRSGKCEVMMMRGVRQLLRT